ncbi:MAG: hypothetical protein IT437_10365 [Phycisphaerales bacterium]|nr:hypothetical protein [Phycisphaerales bacterium]
MIEPSPTAPIDRRLARGVLMGMEPATATKPAHVVFTVPNTDYEMHLVPTAEVRTRPGKRLVGTIRARARRIDVVLTGGRYVEPVWGRPRRVQGSVVAVEPDAVVVDAGMPIHCVPTDPRQKPADFAPGQFVSFNVMDGATFTEA